MYNKTTTQVFTVLGEKKRWESPTLIVIDSNNVKTGVAVTSLEGTVALSKTPTFVHS